jgi:hypothetical protein
MAATMNMSRATGFAAQTRKACNVRPAVGARAVSR